VRKRVVASQRFRSVAGALNTIAGYEAMNIIRKGLIRWLPKLDIVGQARFIERTLGAQSDLIRHRRTIRTSQFALVLFATLPLNLNGLFTPKQAVISKSGTPERLRTLASLTK
jgi:hypothetical protein